MYAKIARYYDALHEELRADIGFVLALAGRVGGPLLECGCGTGRVALPLARAGFAVTGIDASPDMLSLAEQKLRQEKNAVRAQLNLVQADMTDFALPETEFNLAVVSYNTFLHLGTPEKQKALRAIHLHLRPGGTLFLDLANPHTLAQTPNDHLLTLERVLALPKTAEQVLVMACNHLDAAEQTLTITWLYDRIPAGGGAVMRELVTGHYHYLYAHEMELLLRDHGFTPVAFYGNYNQEPFDEEGERLLVLATRA